VAAESAFETYYSDVVVNTRKYHASNLLQPCCGLNPRSPGIYGWMSDPDADGFDLKIAFLSNHNADEPKRKKPSHESRNEGRETHGGRSSGLRSGTTLISIRHLLLIFFSLNDFFYPNQWQTSLSRLAGGGAHMRTFLVGNEPPDPKCIQICHLGRKSRYGNGKNTAQRMT
jgi:hypothetical protein